jgi:hypothetical protein
MSKKINIMRLLRMQLKSGYLLEEPAEYTYMKRYPPLGRDSKPAVRQLEVKSVPYLRLYQDALTKNPLYEDERVFPAYWQQEPQALVLAKKQYEMMKQGFSEEDAYHEAVTHVEKMETKSFEELKRMLEKSGNSDAIKPFISDPAIAETIAELRIQLTDTRYDDLDEGDQGELDYLIQTKILKWKEVERERRMKDPVFVEQFEKLRKVIFPEMFVVDEASRAINFQKMKEVMNALFNRSALSLCTNAPFYYDDYVFFFEKLKAEPLLGRWNIADRQHLSSWITDTLALREIIEKRPTPVVQRYLDDLRAHFFPMVRYPDRARSFELPSAGKSEHYIY